MSNKSAITLQDIAREAGVSRALASFALNNSLNANGKKKYNVSEETTERIKEIATKYGYRPNVLARSLRIKKTSTIGVILPDISNAFFSTFARLIEDKATEKSYSSFFVSTDESATRMNKAIEDLIDKGVDGLILAPCTGSEEMIRTTANNDTVPIVLFDRDVEDCNVDKVLFDNILGAEMAVKTLYGEGRRHIEMVSYTGRLSNIISREEGYVKAMESLDIGGTANIHRAAYDTYNEEVTAVIRSIDFNKTDAVLFATNSLAISGIKEMMRLGVDIGGKVGIATYDRGEPFDLFPCRFTSILQPLDEYAAGAFDMIIRRIENPAVDILKIIIAPQLIGG